MFANKEVINKAKRRLLQMHYESGVGHIGGNLSCLDALLVTWHDVLTSRDSFILSKGHAAGALYIALWSKGILKDEELKSFHKDSTHLTGHPSANTFDSIAFATGSLGHGLSLASGTALAKKIKGDSGFVICLMSDGEWQEGSTWEALIFLSHHCLNNLIIMIDQNGLQGFGRTEQIASLSLISHKLAGFNLDIVNIDGHDTDQILEALTRPSDLPRIIILNTTKGNGVSFMENQMDWHYLPLTQKQYEQAINEIKE
jgi:transketolase